MLSLGIAVRFLRRSPVQSLLIAAGIAVGIGVQVFLGSLITSLQASLVERTIGNAPQVTVTAAREGRPVTWDEGLRRAFARQDEVTTVVPLRRFSAILRSGAGTTPLQLVGGDLRRLDTIYDLSGRVVRGRAELGGNGLVLGKEAAAKAGLAPGERATVVLPDGTVARLTVRGVADFGARAANAGTGFVDAAFAARALGLEDDQYTEVAAQVADVFRSVAVADALRRDPALRGLAVSEWQAENADLLSGLRSQSTSSYLIQFFVLVAVALGIASTLAISAVQKTRQIGILKAMGMKDRAAGRIFLWQALLLGVTGAGAGVLAGLGLIAAFSFAGRNSATLFPIRPQVGFIVLSFCVGVAVAALSALIPARRTTRLDPIEVIQGG